MAAHRTASLTPDLRIEHPGLYPAGQIRQQGHKLSEMGIFAAQPIQLTRLCGIQDRLESQHQIMQATEKCPRGMGGQDLSTRNPWHPMARQFAILSSEIRQ
ncbi:MAG: hypothetical protein OXD33_11725 [Rhodobacteraceae bacterium]|nr:hypothetical protein [Paracoccaceae bacterium]